jgi:hypothetical protein
MAGASIITADDIIAFCKKEWEANKSDCSGFVKAVANDLGITLDGQANDIMDDLDGTWLELKDGPAAAISASLGKFVIGGGSTSQTATSLSW